VHGQQLLQAWLSLLLTTEKMCSEAVCLNVKGGHKDVERTTNTCRESHRLLTAHVIQDLQAHTCDSRHPEEQRQRRELQKQQAGQGDGSSASRRHLPHPQLVSATLGLARHHYGRITDFRDRGEPAAAAATAGVASNSSSTACCADTNCSCIGAHRNFCVDPTYDSSVASLVGTLAGFTAAPQLGQQPAASAWKEALGLTHSAAVGTALGQGLQVYSVVTGRVSAYAHLAGQRREAELQRLQAVEQAINESISRAGTKALLDWGQASQQSQQSAPSLQLAAPQQAQLPSTSNKQAKRHKSRQQAAAVVQLPDGVNVPRTVFDACCAGAGQLGQLLSAYIPSRHTCNGPLCMSLASVSESFALVRGRACVCGCCTCVERPAGNLRDLAFRWAYRRQWAGTLFMFMCACVGCGTRRQLDWF
jgi:hypothetical protein